MFPTRWILNDGRWSAEEHEELVRKAAQAWKYRDWNRELEDEVRREKEAHERSIRAWEAKIALQQLPDHADIPHGPPPKETSSTRALPDVHAALRQNDPSMVTGSQPVLKKAPRSAGRPMPKGFYSDKEPPRIGTSPVQPTPPSTPRPWEVQQQEVSLLQASTPMTPARPPRPPIAALPKPMPMESSMSSKHSVESSSQQGPPKQARHKPFPFSQPPPVSTSTASLAVAMPRPGAPIPRIPPASFMPTPGDVQQMSSSSPAADPSDRDSDSGKIKVVRSSTDIDWTRPLHKQLEPNLKGGPRESTTFDDLCMLRSRIPKLSLDQFDDIYPSDNIIRVVQKSHGVHQVKMSEVAAWVLSATHWYALLKQPMMVVIWCRDWNDASRFQYLMQILQVQFHDYVPK